MNASKVQDEFFQSVSNLGQLVASLCVSFEVRPSSSFFFFSPNSFYSEVEFSKMRIVLNLGPVHETDDCLYLLWFVRCSCFLFAIHLVKFSLLRTSVLLTLRACVSYSRVHTILRLVHI